MTSIISDKDVVTRKDHKCFACLRRFPKGTEMHCQVNNYDGEIGSIYMCKTCVTLMDEFQPVFFDDCDLVYPEGCVNYSVSDEKVKSPEELLIKFREEKITH